jgi:uncharacterized protein YidB (DUF937 family)
MSPCQHNGAGAGFGGFEKSYQARSYVMGLLEDLLGGALGGAQQRNAPAQQGQGGMSPVMLALMALMAYRAMSGNAAPQQQRGAPGAQAASDNPLGDLLGSVLGGGQMGGAHGGGGMGGGLGDILGQVLGGGAQGGGARRVPQSGGGSMGGGSMGGLGDILGGILAGGAAGGGLGNVLNGGLGDILKQLQENGQGDAADSWIGHGQNKQIDPRDLEAALGRDKMKSLAEQAGMSDIQFMHGLAQGLPQVIDRMTPDGRLPTREEAERWV